MALMLALLSTIVSAGGQKIDKKHLDGHGEILRISASATDDVGMDLIGFEDPPGDDYDDPSDDDTTEDYTDESSSSPRFGMMGVMGVLISALLMFTIIRRRPMNKLPNNRHNLRIS